MDYPRINDPEKYLVDESSIIPPTEELRATEVVRGPNIKPFPEFDALPDTLEAEVALKVGDNISTDGIMPAGNKVLPLRSNIEAISEFVFYQIAPDFSGECKKKGNVVVVGGRELRPGLQPRARRPGPALPRGAGQDRQELRPHPQGQPVQFRHPAADLQKPGGL